MDEIHETISYKDETNVIVAVTKTWFIETVNY